MVAMLVWQIYSSRFDSLALKKEISTTARERYWHSEWCSVVQRVGTCPKPTKPGAPEAGLHRAAGF